MAVRSAQINVTTTAVQLTAVATLAASITTLALSNGGAVSVYLGPAGVTASNGFPLAAGAAMSLDLQTGVPLFGVVASGSATVSVLQTGI